MSDENKTIDITPEQAREILWRKGNLSFLLDSNQVEMVNLYKNSVTKTLVWSMSRRIGKSYTLCVIAIELCLTKKNAVVKFLQPKQKDVRTNIRPLMREIIASCPEELKPIEKSSASEWVFPSTGSKIQFAGCDNGRAESVRGSNADLCIIDEAGFVSRDLDYIVNSILLPTTTMTKGKIILCSTPPKSQSHEFVTFINIARHEGAYCHKNVFHNPRLTKADIDLLAKAAGGYESVNFRREYLAQIIKDDNYAIVPEFNEELKAKIVKEWPRPPFYDTYVAMDVGMKDLTVVLFAYFDFRVNKLIIEDEYVINGQQFTTDALARGIKEREAKIFTHPVTGECPDPFKRVSDNNLILINDLYRLHGLIFHPTRKDDADAALNNMRIMLKDELIIINPRCKTLILHLESGVWNKSKTSFDRSGDKGHFDAIDSLKYLVRNVEFQKNPYPAYFGTATGPNVFYQTKQVTNTNFNNLKKILNIK
jgi:hypothetical protein